MRSLVRQKPLCWLRLAGHQCLSQMVAGLLGRRLDVGAEPFHGVLCVLGFSAMPGHLAALQRCHTVLRPGGHLSVCDARLFSGRHSRLNRLVRSIYVPATGWNPERDVAFDIERVFGNVTVELFNAGTFFVAGAEKRENAA
jgi:hypothetical protein